MSENKPRAVASAQQRNNECNPGEIITEGNKHSVKNTRIPASATVDSTVMTFQNAPNGKATRAFQIANRNLPQYIFTKRSTDVHRN